MFLWPKKTRLDDSPSSGEWPADSPIHACQCKKRGSYASPPPPPLNLPSCFQKITSHRGFAETVTQSRIRDTRVIHCLGPGCTTLELSLAQLGVSVSPLNGFPIRDSVETPWGQKKQEKCKPVPVVLTKTPPIKVKAVSR